MCLWFLGSHGSRCSWFLAHTDPTDLTDFLWVVNLTELFGGEVGGFWAHTDPTDLTDFSVGGKSHGIFLVGE